MLSRSLISPISVQLNIREAEIHESYIKTREFKLREYLVIIWINKGQRHTIVLFSRSVAFTKFAEIQTRKLLPFDSIWGKRVFSEKVKTQMGQKCTVQSLSVLGVIGLPSEVATLVFFILPAFPMGGNS